MADGIQFKMDASQGINKIVKALDKCKSKEVANRLGIMLEDEIRKYIPVGETGKLSRKKYGYVMRTGVNKDGAWVKFEVNNDKLVYAMYQYYGEVWGPNFAQFDAYGNQIPGAWKSPNPKHKQSNPIGVERTVELKDGRIVHITGYTNNKNAHAKWVEYVRDVPTIWNPLRYKMWTDVRDTFRKYAK